MIQSTTPTGAPLQGVLAPVHPQCKQFSVPQLMARVNALRRRGEYRKASEIESALRAVRYGTQFKPYD